MRFGDPLIPLSLKRFRLFRDLINKHFGIYYEDADRYLMESRLRERLIHLDLESFEKYYHHIKYNSASDRELEHCAEILTTNETYFYREDYQLRAFANEILPNLFKKHRIKKRMRIWSAGCSSGEEAYTIAMIIHDSGLFDDWDIRIFGSDISAQMLTKARNGIYGTSSFRVTSPDIMRRHFDKTDEGFRIKDNIKSMCHFGRINLLDEEKIILVGRVDVIFCRNVLIYFDALSKNRGISALYDRLNSGGYLLLGHTESLLNLSTAFELVHLSEDLVYRRSEIINEF